MPTEQDPDNLIPDAEPGDDFPVSDPVAPTFKQTEELLFALPDATDVCVSRPADAWLPDGVETEPFGDRVIFNITVGALKAAWAAQEGD
ncbi:hypothetical protein [Sphingomonas sanxanigenens]|uniref:Uncharacterized protein n=1 Tax=Sphingomonas sanxanigenens DSM 19645 = NX02 TaxID=1123269 RepID=W0A839_9SPHN|nr:hypothetical protein [Sphingomonas sanxanigenens]AHE52647.1 hypothetical protein NX02_04515 [Sphingomonas sanxanigenens DSM 19645 = NX02]